MTFYGVIHENDNVYKPFLKFEAKSDEAAIEYIIDMISQNSTLMKYDGRIRVSKTGVNIYMIDSIIGGII